MSTMVTHPSILIGCWCTPIVWTESVTILSHNHVYKSLRLT